MLVPLTHGEGVNRQDVHYQCSFDERKANSDQKELVASLPPERHFIVSYLNADTAALAAFPVDSKMLVFANIVSGSGAKYVADRYAWTTEGDEAMFSRVDREDSAINCHVVTVEAPSKSALNPSPQISSHSPSESAQTGEDQGH
nr:MliC family protein [Saccharibacter sp. 17.LH.SD]